MSETRENEKVTSNNEITLLPHNQMLYDKIVAEINKGERSIFYSEATGLGKSFIFMKLVQEYFKGKKVLYIVPKIAIWHNLTNYKEFNALDATIEMTTFAAFNKYSSDSEMWKDYDVVFVDECHHMLSDIQGVNVAMLLEDMKTHDKYSFGMTATPYYKGTYVDEVWFDVSCYGYDVKEAIELGILPRINFAIANIDFDSIPADTRVRYSINGTKTLLECLIKEHTDKQKWIAYFLNKDELEQNVSQLKYLFPDYEILKVYEGVGNEAEVFEQFNSTSRRVILMSVNKLLEGIHLKGVQGVLLYRNVTEFSTYMQMYGRLCDIKAKVSPIFLDVANAIVSINKISESSIFRSSRYKDERKEYRIRDFFDVHAEDYWTVELCDMLTRNTRTYKEYRGIEWNSKRHLISLLHRHPEAVRQCYEKFKGCSGDIDHLVIDWYLKDSTYEEYKNNGYIGKFKECGYEYDSYNDLARQIGTSVTYTTYCHHYKHNEGDKPTLAEYIGHFTKPDEKIYYRGVDITTRQSAGEYFGSCGSRVSSWILEVEGRTIEQWVDYMFNKSEVYREVRIGTYRTMAEDLGIAEHLVEAYAIEDRCKFVDYMLDCYGKSYRNVVMSMPDSNRMQLHVTSNQWKQLNGNDVSRQKELIDYVYSLQYRGAIPVNIDILAKQLGRAGKYVRARVNKGLTMNQIIDESYLDKETKEGKSEKEYLEEVESRRRELGYL